MKRPISYVVLNLLFAAGVVVATVVRPEAGIHPLYLVLLFLLCSSPLLDMTHWNDRYVLLAVFSGFYFVLYGLLDTVHLILSTVTPVPVSAGVGGDSLLSQTELLILVGSFLTQLGYRLACRVPADKLPSAPDRDWPENSLVVFGCLLWAITTALTWRYEVDVIVALTPEGSTGLEHISQFQALIYMIAAYLQPLGIVLLAYAQCRHRRRYLLAVIAAAISVEMALGFVADMKGEVFLGLILVLLTKFLIDGRVPKLRVAVLLMLIAALFPILQANRAVRGEYNINHVQAAQAIVDVFKRALSEKETVSSGPGRAQSFIERSSLKGSVDLIVSHTGRDVPFQHGHTLAPVLTTFIPRILWPTKPDVQTGRVMNLAFLVAPDQPGTYISPSHLGEFYWNYGWPGAVVGMLLVGLLFGFVGARFDLSQSVTLTRLLVIIITIKLLILGQESSIAVQYSMWLRCMVAVWLLHVLFTRPLVGFAARTERLFRSTTTVSPRGPSDLSASPPFANLMR